MANSFESAELVFPSGVKYQATRILTSGGEPDDRPSGWIALTTEAEGRTWAVGAAGPATVEEETHAESQ